MARIKPHNTPVCHPERNHHLRLALPRNVLPLQLLQLGWNSGRRTLSLSCAWVRPGPKLVQEGRKPKSLQIVLMRYASRKRLYRTL